MLVLYRSQIENRESPLIFDDVVLRPGNNDINPSLWKKAMKLSAIKKKIDAKVAEGIIVILNESSETINLRAYTVVEAAKIIADTFDVDLLQQWKEHDTRKGIIEDIDAQIEAITKKGQGEGDKDPE